MIRTAHPEARMRTPSGKGRIFLPESRIFRDALTGAAVRQVTAAPCIHHHPFYYLPAYDDAMRWLVFVSHRNGAAQIFAEERSTGRLIQLTDRPDINGWSLHPSHDGRFVYFTAGCGAWRVSTEDFSEELLAMFATDSITESSSMVASGMGTTTLSRDDRWWAVPVKDGPVSRLHVIDTQTGSAEVILERDTICHPQFHPDDATLLRYGGPWHDRLWIINRDGTGDRLVYSRDAAKKEWIVHETWRPGTREVLTAKWPRGVIGVDIDTGAVRSVCAFNAWHPMINRSGTLMVTDTKNPDRGLQLFDPCNGSAAPQLLCLSEASNAGEHWNIGHCPYDDGVKHVVAPQHTHPHPSFSPDGRFVVFTSDRTGHAQIYEVELPQDPRAMTADGPPVAAAALSRRNGWIVASAAFGGLVFDGFELGLMPIASLSVSKSLFGSSYTPALGGEWFASRVSGTTDFRAQNRNRLYSSCVPIQNHATTSPSRKPSAR